MNVNDCFKSSGHVRSAHTECIQSNRQQTFTTTADIRVWMRGMF